MSNAKLRKRGVKFERADQSCAHRESAAADRSEVSIRVILSIMSVNERLTRLKRADQLRNHTNIRHFSDIRSDDGSSVYARV
jgi:hypothetical protein